MDGESKFDIRTQQFQSDALPSAGSTFLLCGRFLFVSRHRSSQAETLPEPFSSVGQPCRADQIRNVPSGEKAMPPEVESDAGDRRLLLQAADP